MRQHCVSAKHLSWLLFLYFIFCVNQKRQFLKSKGLTDADIDAACVRAGVPLADPPPLPESWESRRPAWGKTLREMVEMAALLGGVAYGLYRFWKVGPGGDQYHKMMKCFQWQLTAFPRVTSRGGSLGRARRPRRRLSGRPRKLSGRRWRLSSGRWTPCARPWRTSWGCWASSGRAYRFERQSFSFKGWGTVDKISARRFRRGRQKTSERRPSRTKSGTLRNSRRRLCAAFGLTHWAAFPMLRSELRSIKGILLSTWVRLASPWRHVLKLERAPKELHKNLTLGADFQWVRSPSLRQYRPGNWSP